MINNTYLTNIPLCTSSQQQESTVEVYGAINSVLAEAHETLAIMDKELSDSAIIK
ncbi:hypothetical protein [Alteromonas sp. S005]|uniref:hypothetical protein n=1 Tax=Alteromonas sp. S005 TaxID=3117400 RepID=UPI002FE1C10F